ncbi:hypothetical protein [Candidatus Oscillochloris fontis]|uniref:hypothetical protein n=1 Tax=Candidatus Oscillochloris fontis TaxID=2496868 RepID=UPI00101DA0F5|nr:hypothetical protein [Candidatus Oscillochloris fontis]
MNVALIALPSANTVCIPPLSLAYLATLLEQRRHIVRIYDLGLDPETAWSSAFLPLRSFRPHILVVAGDQAELRTAALEALHQDQHEHVLVLPMSRSSLDAHHVCCEALTWIQQQRGGTDGCQQNLAALESIDALPFPSRHLLSLEGYNLRAVGGELQTTMLIAGRDVRKAGDVVLRVPSQIVAELRTVAAEFGLRHFLFPDVLLTMDHAWLVEMLRLLCDAQLMVRWEASADAELLDAALMVPLAQAGCEALTLTMRASRVFESAETRHRVSHVVSSAHDQGIYVRANVLLEPPYESVPHLVDVAATFNLDAVCFEVPAAEVVGASADTTQVAKLAHQIYDAGRDRQRFINRFGPALGSLIWRLRGQRGSS